MSTFRPTLLAIAIVFLLLVGVGMRLAPLATDGRTVAAISEDGYLMLTVARNVALGRSLTIAEGTISTNGVQPFVTFVWAGLHWLSDGERLPALRSVIVVQFAVALATALFVGLLAREVFREQPWRDAGALVAASLWFASPLALKHTTNGLETGPYVCAIAAVLLVDLRWRRRSAARAMVLGAMLGGLFLFRNDAVFLIFAFLLAELSGFDRVGPGAKDGARAFGQRLATAVLMGVTALAVASPWLVYNARVFGHIVPVSGRAQNLNAGVGGNLPELARVLAEYAWVATPLPAQLAASAFSAMATGAVLAGALILTIRRARAMGLVLNRWIMLLLFHCGFLAAYYGLFFGAAYFVSRYLFPLSLIAVLIPCIWIMPGGSRGRGAAATAGQFALAAMSLLVVFAATRLYARSAAHDHGQVVDWVSTNLTPATWVGAPQSGTLGYFHDRTVNLDGKVNPEALRARRENRLFHYIVDDTPIEYIADWYGLARWVDRPDTIHEERDVDLLKRHFDVVVRDPGRNLFVLRRLDVPPGSGAASH